MVKVFLLIAITFCVIFIAVFLYNNNQYVTYEVDKGNICQGGQTTLAPRQMEEVTIKKSEEGKYVEELKKKKKCFLKV